MTDRFQGRRPWERQSLATILTILMWGIIVGGMSGSAPSWGSEGDPEAIDFVHEVVPILRQHCGNCHIGNQREGGLSLNTRADVLAGGDSGAAVTWTEGETSELIRRITSEDEGEWMPPEGERLAPEEIALLQKWVAARLPWDEEFRFVKPSYTPPLRPRRPELPEARANRDNPVDRILDDYLEKVSPVGAEPFSSLSPISDVTFLRRVHLDLIGLLPTPEELTAFLEDGVSDKRSRLIDDLLARDRDYTEHWLTFWNDLLRNDYTGTGFITGGRKQITAWLYDSLSENKPYDQMVRELIVPSSESEGFSLGIRWRGDINSSQTQEVQFAQNVSQAFLGINMKCASCHDSFVDDWKLEQAYGLAAIISSDPLELHRCDKPTGTMAKAAWVFPELGDIDPEAPKRERLRQLAELMTHPENGRLSRTIVNRLWHRLMGRGIVHPTDAMDIEPWSPDLLDFLAVDLADHEYDLKRTLRVICNSEAYQSQISAREQPTEQEAPAYAGPLARRLTAEQFVDAVWQLTGAYPDEIDAPIEPRSSDSEPNAPRARASLMKSDFLMRSLGRPNRDQIVTMRPTEFTTLEAIDLANGESLNQAITQGATRLKAEQGDSLPAIMTWLYQYGLARNPTAGELALANETWGANASVADVEDLIWAVIMLPEFQWVR
jgi:hypothetical protein